MDALMQSAVIRRPQILADVLRNSVVRGERTIDMVRIIAALMVAGVVVMSDWALVSTLATRSVITLGGLLLGVLLSLLNLWRKTDGTQRRLVMSGLLDALLVTVAIVPTMLWPRPEYPGQILMPSIHFYGMAIILSGLRLDRRLVLFSTGLNVALVSLVLVCDVLLNGYPKMGLQQDFGLCGALFTMYAVLGMSISVRAHRLVEDGSDAVLDAERARQALGIYVSEAIADEVLDMDHFQPGGSLREVVVMFSDLRGFTAYSESLPPERLVRELNAYLDTMVDVIRDEDGIVDKYIGDAIMVVFGLPAPRADDANRAVRCAARMQTALEQHNRDRAQQGLPPLRQGLGLHRGHAVAGNIGSNDRLQYTVIGATVNLASRLEYATKDAGVSVLISQSVVDALHEEASTPRLAPHDVLTLRGTTQPVTVWTLAPSESDAQPSASPSD